MTRMWRYVKSFGITSLLFGATGAFFMGLRFGPFKGLLAGMIAAVGWGILMAVLLVPLDLLMTRKIPADSLHLDQARELEVQGAWNQVFELLKRTLTELRFVKNFEPMLDKGLIYGQTRPSWASFGEEITIEVKALDKARTRVKISSRPRYKYTLIDYGKNYRNVESIARTFETSFPIA